MRPTDTCQMKVQNTYLFLYNFVQLLGWSFVLLETIRGLITDKDNIYERVGLSVRKLPCRTTHSFQKLMLRSSFRRCIQTARNPASPLLCVFVEQASAKAQHFLKRSTQPLVILRNLVAMHGQYIEVISTSSGLIVLALVQVSHEVLYLCRFCSGLAAPTSSSLSYTASQRCSPCPLVYFSNRFASGLCKGSPQHKQCIMCLWSSFQVICAPHAPWFISQTSLQAGSASARRNTSNA